MSIGTETFYRLKMYLCTGIGPRIHNDLIKAFGSAQQVFEASKKELLQIPRIQEEIVRELHSELLNQRTEKEWTFSQQNSVQILHEGMPEYPFRLRDCQDAPPIVFYKGNASLNSSKVVGIVGTRSMTPYGQHITEQLVDELKDEDDLLIVSGLAAGIDAMAHRQAVKNGIANIGVLGHGIDRIYPSEHKQLAEQICTNGGLLTEFVRGTKPDRTNFPMRNRIVAGMCDVTVLTESNAKGGAMITAYLAQSYHREVATFPARITDHRSAGCNLLIKKNIAALIENANDLLELMNWKKAPKRPAQQLSIILQKDAQQIWNLLNEKDELHVDQLSLLTGLSTAQLAATLLEMEMNNLLQSLPGKRYRLR